MARKLMISNVVQVPVTAVLANGAGKADTHKFTLTCKRMDGEELRQALTREDVPVIGFLSDIVTGWAGQKLVAEDDGSPSEFSQDALQDLLSIAGVPNLCLAAYLKEVIATQKN